MPPCTRTRVPNGLSADPNPAIPGKFHITQSIGWTHWRRAKAYDAQTEQGRRGPGRTPRGCGRRPRQTPPEEPEEEKAAPEAPVATKKEEGLDLTGMKRKTIAELVKVAQDLGIQGASGLRKQDLIFKILEAQTQQNGLIFAEGVLEILPEGYGFLRSPDYNYLPSPDDIYVSPSQIKRFDLRTGDTVSGQVRPPKDGERYFALLRVEAVNFESPEVAKSKTLFDNLTPLYPMEKINLEMKNRDLTTRIIDLLCPIGKGQRGLIVSPPKAGKTMILQKIANSITENHPEVVLIVLLIDERPEEVTDMERSVAGRGDQLDLRRAGRAPRAGGRDGDREGAAPGRAQARRGRSCSTRSPVWRAPTTRSCRTAARSSRAASTPTRCTGRSASSARRATSRRAASLTIMRHGPHRNRQPHGRRHLRGVQGHREHGARPRPQALRQAHLPGDRPEPLAARARRSCSLPEGDLRKIWILRKFLSEMNPVEAMEFLIDKMSKTKTNRKFLESMNG